MKLLVAFALFVALVAARKGFKGTEQEWGFSEVRPGAHIFWWLYYTTSSEKPTDRPLVIWLQGGPGASSTGFGNFQEFGPLDDDLKPRNYTWVNNCNVMFIDNPVGTGFSYVDKDNLLVKNNQEIAQDLLTMLKDFYKQFPNFEKTPLYIFSESYGGKMAAEFALVLDKAIKNKEINSNLKGVAMGDSWISPIDALLTWGPYLLNVGMVDQKGSDAILSVAKAAQKAIESGNWDDATNYFSSAEGTVESVAGGVDFYNILQKVPGYGSMHKVVNGKRMPILPTGIKTSVRGNLDRIMNVEVRKALNITGKSQWCEQSLIVFDTLGTDFMKPVTQVVETLLNTTDIKVIVYNGELDLIVDTPGTMSWVNALNWKSRDQWWNSKRNSLVRNGIVEGFKKKYENFAMYWVSRAGHMVPADNPDGMHAVLADVIDKYEK